MRLDTPKTGWYCVRIECAWQTYLLDERNTHSSRTHSCDAHEKWQMRTCMAIGCCSHIQSGDCCQIDTTKCEHSTTFTCWRSNHSQQPNHWYHSINTFSAATAPRMRSCKLNSCTNHWIRDGNSATMPIFRRTPAERNGQPIPAERWRISTLDGRCVRVLERDSNEEIELRIVRKRTQCTVFWYSCLVLTHALLIRRVPPENPFINYTYLTALVSFDRFFYKLSIFNYVLHGRLHTVRREKKKEKIDNKIESESFSVTTRLLSSQFLFDDSSIYVVKKKTSFVFET